MISLNEISRNATFPSPAESISSTDSLSTITQQSPGATDDSYYSSKPHRYTQRMNTLMNGLGNLSSALDVSLAALIPTKVAQIALSGKEAMRADIKPTERATHASQATLSFVQLMLILALFFQNKSCGSKTDPLCKVFFVTDALYRSILLLNWGAAELFRDNQPVSQSLSRGNRNSLFHSSRKHRIAQRSNMMMDSIANIDIAAGAPLTALIPTKIGQIILSGKEAIQPARPGIKQTERVTHGIQAALAFMQLMLIVALFFQDKSYNPKTNVLYKLFSITDLLYRSILMLNWGAAELFKEDENEGSEDSNDATTSYSASISEQNNDVETQYFPHLTQFGLFASPRSKTPVTEPNTPTATSILSRGSKDINALSQEEILTVNKI